MNLVTKFVAHVIVAAALCLALHPAGAQSGYVRITPGNVSQLTQLQRIGNGVPRQMTFSPDGSTLAAATTLGVWVITPPSLIPSPTHAEQGDAERQLLDGQGGAESVTFSPDGSMIAAGGEDNSVMVWDTASGEAVERLENHIYPVTAVAWSQDGKYIASGDESGVVRVWDTATWSEYRLLTVTGTIDHLVFLHLNTLTVYTPDARTDWDFSNDIVLFQDEPLNYGSNFILEAGTTEGYAAWDKQQGQIVIFDRNVLLAASDDFFGELDGVAFGADGKPSAQPFRRQPDETPAPVPSPDGSRVASFGNDGVIRLSDAATGREIAALHGHIRAVTGVAFSPDGRLLASSGYDGTIRLWGIQG